MAGERVFERQEFERLAIWSENLDKHSGLKKQLFKDCNDFDDFLKNPESKAVGESDLRD